MQSRTMLIVGVCLYHLQTISAQAPETGRAVVEKYIKAAGGPALSDIRTETRKGTLLRGRTGKVPLDIAAAAPGRWRYDQTFAWGDRVCYICDGKDAWIQDTERIVGMDRRQRLDMELLFDVQAPLKLREWLPDLKVTGSEQIGEKEAVTLTGTSAEGVTIELAFDRETGLLLRAGDFLFEDYRDVGNVRRPFRILLGRNRGEENLQMTMEFTEIRHDLDMDDSLFQAPACLLSPADPPLYTRRHPVEVGLEALDACVGEYRDMTNPDVTFTVSRQNNHLMLTRTGWRQKIEIIPESEIDYYTQFLGWEFHFMKDEAGGVTHLAIGKDRTPRAEKIR